MDDASGESVGAAGSRSMRSAFVASYVALALNIAVRVHLLRIRYRLAPSLPTAVGQLTP